MYQKSQVLPPHLQKMIFEMELRGYAQYTKDHYLGHLRLLEKHTNKSVAEITPDELRQYLHDRIKFGIGYSSINLSCYAFKLFFNKVLGYNWSDDVIIRPKQPKFLPYVLSRDEILSITDQVQNLRRMVRFHGCMGNLYQCRFEVDASTCYTNRFFLTSRFIVARC